MESTDNMDNEVKNMIEAKHICDNIPQNLQSATYKKIIEEINFFLQLYCRHELVDDYFDIDPEKSINVTYCAKCKLCFS